MSKPGQDSGQVESVAVDSGAFDWGGFVAGLVERRGTLTAVAEDLAAQRGYEDDVASVERALRRLRARGEKDGGVWGKRALSAFGLPSDVTRRLRWMGLYHSRFTDLPTSICFELLQRWNRPPVSESRGFAWVHLGLASVWLRRRRREEASRHIEQAALMGLTDAAARVEHALVRAYLHSRDVTKRDAALKEAEAALPEVESTDDAACFRSRLVDQMAYRLNKPRDPEDADPVAALKLYESLPEDAPAFARCRRHNGLGWSKLRLGRFVEAREHGRRSLRIAGDSGSLRLRAMALNLLAHAHGEGTTYGERAREIAKALEDEELSLRYRRVDM